MQSEFVADMLDGQILKIIQNNNENDICDLQARQEMIQYLQKQ